MALIALPFVLMQVASVLFLLPCPPEAACLSLADLHAVLPVVDVGDEVGPLVAPAAPVLCLVVAMVVNLALNTHPHTPGVLDIMILKLF